jgi:radical SAM superfamily enzyme YgiQ (UPF0313 family)
MSLKNGLLLVNPPLENFEEDPYPPLGLAYIAAVIEKEGFNVKIFDMPILQANIHKAREYFQQEKPDVVGIGCVAANYSYAIALARLVKKLLNCIVVLGGPQVTFVAKEVLKENPEVDIVVRGEGEITMLELLRSIAESRDLSNILGITYRDYKGNIRSNPDRPLIREIDELPFPARHLLPMQNYRKLNKFTSIMGGRGCIYNCIYCSSSAFWRNTIRFRKPEKIVEEIGRVHNEYGYMNFKFIDDIFVFSGNRAKKLLEMLKRLYVNASIKWSCNTRIDLVSKESLRRALESGCDKITFGIESCSSEVLQTIGKNFNVDQVKNIVKFAREIGIRVKLNFIFGLPGQSKEEVLRVLKLIEEAKPSEVMMTQLTPYPGTEIVKNPLKYGVEFADINWWMRGSEKSTLCTNTLSYDEIVSSVSLIREGIKRLNVKTMEGY